MFVREADFEFDENCRNQSTDVRRLAHRLVTKFSAWGAEAKLYRALYRLYNLLPANWKSLSQKAFIRLGIKSFLDEKYFELAHHGQSKQRKNGTAYTDLSWNQFENQILKFRDSYAGVFVQERVIPWNTPLFQRPQQIALALGKLNVLVIYQTHPYGVDSDIADVRQVAKNVWVTHLDAATEVSHALRSTYSGSLSDMSLHSSSQKILYEYVDHIDAQIVGAQAVPELEKKKELAFNGSAHFIAASAHALFNEALGRHPAVELIPNGVDFELFQEGIRPELRNPKAFDFKSNFKYTVGYFGALAPWLWHELINELAERHPDIGFIFVGPDYGGGETGIKKSRNIMFTGPVRHDLIPSFASCFDVGFIPFRLGPIAQSTNPLKLYEYFAAGLPVIVTKDLHECIVFEDFVSVVEPGDNLTSKLDALVSRKNDVVWKKAINKVAELNSWSNRAEKILRKFIS